MDFISKISYMLLGAVLTLLSGLAFLAYRQKQIQKEFERFSSFDELRDQMEEFKKNFSQGPNFSKEIDSMMKNFEEDSNKKEKIVEVKGKKNPSEEGD